MKRGVENNPRRGGQDWGIKGELLGAEPTGLNKGAEVGGPEVSVGWLMGGEPTTRRQTLGGVQEGDTEDTVRMGSCQGLLGHM